MQHRVNTHSPFFTVFINTTVDFCRFMNGTDNNNPVMWWIYNMISKTVPQKMLHHCPYHGIFEAMNLTLVPNSRVVQFLRGYYRTFIRFYDGKDENILTIITGVELI